MDRGGKNKGRAREAGFTLVELMVVIAIIAILATIVGVNVLGAMDDAAVAKAQAQIRNFKTALTAYKLKFKSFPSTSEGLNALVSNAKGVNFLDSKEVPSDPWDNEYQYTLEDSRTFVVVSYGADRASGGSGYDADISSDSLESKEK
jgi:general secretion pathway protein G